MLIERHLSLAITVISLAFLVPESFSLLEQPSQVPGITLAVGAVIGAIGIYLGSAVACTYWKKVGRTLRLIAWGILGLGMSTSTLYFGSRAQGWWAKLLFLSAGCLPLLAHVTVLFKGWQKPG